MIRLTTLTQVFTEAAEDKLDKFEQQMFSEREPEEDMWERLGLPNPNLPGGEEKGGLDPDSVVFGDEDFEYIESYCLVKPNRIDLILDKEVGSEVFLESGKSFTAKEKPEEIEILIAKSS